MISFDDYPFRVIREALTTMVGRVVLVMLAMLFGGWLAGWSATHSLRLSLIGVTGLPELSLTSIMAGMGFVVFPAILCFAVAFIRWQWPLWTCVFCTALMWWNVHGTIRWAVYDGPLAKKMQAFDASLKQAIERQYSRNKPPPSLK